MEQLTYRALINYAGNGACIVIHVRETDNLIKQ